MFCNKKVLASVIKAKHMEIKENIGRYKMLMDDAWPAILGIVLAAFVIECHYTVCMWSELHSSVILSCYYTKISVCRCNAEYEVNKINIVTISIDKIIL